MKHYNIDLLVRKATDIRRAERLLKEYAGMGKEGFLRDETVVSSAKYQLIVAAEAAQAICNHVAARVAERAPAGYSDCYVILGEEGVINRPLAERLSAMAKFRNLIVHQYGRIDDGWVHGIIGKVLQDVNQFLAAISVFTGAEIT